MEILIYIGILLVVAGIVIESIYLIHKYNITKNELNFVGLVLKLVDYIVGKFEFQYKNSVSQIVNYTLEAVSIVSELKDTNDNEQIQISIFEKAKEICMENGIDVDEGIETIIYEIVSYIIEDKLVKI
jgi:hypothetical protein